MSLNTQRRIFRGTGPARPRLPWRLVILLLGITAAGGGAAVLASGGMQVPAERHAAAQPAILHAPAHAVAVVSGDTLRLDGHVIRLQGISAPPRGRTCQPDLDCGTASAASLAGLVRGRALECRLHGRDAMGRRYGDCVAGGADLGRAQIAAGWARAEPHVGALAALEQDARARRLGVWAGG